MKLINENIEHTFTRRGEDKLGSIGIGTRELIKKWLENHRIQNYIINKDLSIDVKDNVKLFILKLENFPEYIKFNTVDGDFNIAINNLTSLRGCPLYVGQDFSCSKNLLTSLEYGPLIVNKNYYCGRNLITSLIGCPKTVNGDFHCHDNKLNSFDTLTSIIKGDLICDGNNYNLKEKNKLIKREIIGGQIRDNGY